MARAVWEPNTLDKFLRPPSKETEQKARATAAAKRAVAAGAAMFN